MADPKKPQGTAGLFWPVARKSSPREADNPGIGYKGIERGQRYRAVGRWFSVWEVHDIISHAGLPVPHVRLIRVGSPKDVKTVSADILRNRRFYKRA